MVSTHPLRSGLAGFLTLFVAASGLSAQDAPAELDLLTPRAPIHPTGYPRILVLEAPGSALITFRLSIPVGADVDAATAAPILQHLAGNRIRGAAATLGATVEAGASATAISYTITGAAADLDHLTFLLRQATAAPRASEGFAAARTELQDRLARIGETGEGRVESALRARATPGEASVADIRERIRRLTFGDLERLWRSSHDPNAMTLVVVGDVATPALLAALAGLGATPPPDPPSSPLSPSPPPRDRPDLLRRWHGVAWASSPTFDPRAVVAASLAARHLRDQRDGYEAYVRLWEGRSQDVLAVVGSAYGRDATALRRRLAALPSEVAAGLDDARVADVVRRLHWSLLAQARTPWGRANLVGRFLETGADAGAARRYLDGLLAVGVDEVRAYLEALAARPPVEAEAGQ